MASAFFLGSLQGSASVNAISPIVQLWEDIVVRLPTIGLGLLILLAMFAVSGPVASFVLRPFGHLTQSPLIRSVSKRTISILIILLGAYLFLKLAGLTEFAVAIISGTGVLGIILGFAFRDIAENFISSLLLTVQRPFRIGDVVEIDNYLGVIQKVTARATTMVDFDGNHIQIPNSTVYKGVIKNLTANPNMRGQFVIGIGYDANARHAQQLAMQVLQEQEEVLDEPEPQILIDALGSATLNLKVYFWIDVERTSVLKMASVLMRRLVETFDSAGISMPDDAREIIFPQGVPVITDQSGSQRSTPSEEKQSMQHHAMADIKKRSDSHDEDVSSETQEIRRQAAKARDPEGGENIL
ncbi:mechanosensitive ion channel family protein [Salinimonas chungwhensis]|uniref:mechanosensitive ion channel family protein n=1 Tax=Salinimonas chungwhensis TaxID=265425 RepID=UPI000371199D|nr:mechanosensitive ion channel family protein [Salinimonas chungwhensis]